MIQELFNTVYGLIPEYILQSLKDNLMFYLISILSALIIYETLKLLSLKFKKLNIFRNILSTIVAAGLPTVFSYFGYISLYIFEAVSICFSSYVALTIVIEIIEILIRLIIKIIKFFKKKIFRKRIKVELKDSSLFDDKEIFEFTRNWIKQKDENLTRSQYLKATQTVYIEKLSDKISKSYKNPDVVAKKYYNYFIKLWD